ncbi:MULTISPECIES: hypothetical protein [unclassified Chryseobacterium]|uniref:hypothetical protein n=1 Tax=unclassified Chryseobacterium TaxID=2593645 RepID=UPI00100B9781|nr:MULTISPECIES: hypothetical protein [unclassified Chryseobacterium]RXM50311.1 hypothetical protein BOQ64_19710 [Chryseobacterium sp. CH25]RXM62498.1 hypothetical protein BOQ60_20515 [Chryseobacterium sp. CH1]
MKKIILICFLSSINIFSQQENKINIIAEVTKIDSTKGSFIIYINSKSGQGIFSIPKACNNQINYKFKIEKDKSYSFTLKKEIHKHMPENLTKELVEKELVDDKVVWTSKMNSTFYEDCTNMCGLYIDNVYKHKQSRNSKKVHKKKY